ncbi:hypothetical protein EVAR_44202_1 [Eumeta japonica]|uniref:Uncharacterized protein n=1 Tax=Eumeta variegata TaxID=151549 RepID=A0A4C1W3C1_EUMVA|nr:hypothetical protein EVAR_44202_1 [Eumeta japonica]
MFVDKAPYLMSLQASRTYQAIRKHFKDRHYRFSQSATSGPCRRLLRLVCDCGECTARMRHHDHEYGFVMLPAAPEWRDGGGGESPRWETEEYDFALDAFEFQERIVHTWVFFTLLMGVGTGRRTYILPHARASSRRGYDPDGSGDGPLPGVLSVYTSPLIESSSGVWEEVFVVVLWGGIGRSATSLGLVRCSGGIHRGPGQRCQTSGEQRAR